MNESQFDQTRLAAITSALAQINEAVNILAHRIDELEQFNDLHETALNSLANKVESLTAIVYARAINE